MKKTIKNMIKRILGLLCVMAMFLIPTDIVGIVSEELSLEQYDKAKTAEELLAVLDDIFQWRKAQEGLKEQDLLLSGEMLSYAGSSALDWYVLAMGRCGYEEAYEAYGQAMKEQVIAKYKTEDKLDANSATEWHRQILTLLTIGEDPAYITDDMGNVINLVADGTFDRGKTKSLGEQGLNGYIWALLALDSKDYQVPDGALDTRESILKAIVKSQNEDGGFALVEGVSDVDMTAMALQALAPYYEDDTTFSIEGVGGQAQDKKIGQVIDAALKYLSESQLEDGTMGNSGEGAAESTAQVITALCCLDIDLKTDERFLKNGKNLLDGMMLFRNTDGGFSHLLSKEDRESNALVGEQTARALVAYVRFCIGESSIYDFSEDESGRPVKLENHRLLKDYEALQTEIGAINTEIQTYLYPFEDMDQEDNKRAADIVGRIEKMPDYVRDEILEYDKLCKAADTDGSLGIPTVVAIVLVAGAGIVAVILAVSNKNKKKAGNTDGWKEE